MKPSLKLSGRPTAALWRGLALALLLAQLGVTLCHASGSIVPWGANDSGQSVFPSIAINSNFIATAGGASHSLALRKNGTVFAWGNNYQGQADVPVGLTGVSAIAAKNDYSMALKSNGTIVVWGNAPVPPSGLSNVTAIAAGATHSLAIKSDGTIVAWGTPTSAITVPAGITNAIAIAAGISNSVALLANNTVLAWGDASYGKTDVPSGLTGVIAIAAGGDHCLALKRDLSVTAWGRDDMGQVDVPSALEGTVVAIAAGTLHSVALRTNGTLVAWGDSSYSQTNFNSSVTGFIAVNCGGYHSLAIKGDNFPFILVQPYSQEIPISQSVTFQVMASGSQPLSYQWQKDGIDMAGATNAILTLPYVLITDTNTYTVRVSNAFGSVTSLPARVIPLRLPPWITSQPQDASFNCGETATFQVRADGPTNLLYQWQFNGTPIASATSTTLSLPNIKASTAGFYNVIVSNPYGSVTSAVAQLTVIGAPTVTSEPQNTSVYCGKAASFQVSATGPAPLSYQWLFRGTPIAGATSTRFSIDAVGATNDGPYQVVVASPCGSVTSAPAALTVGLVADITSQPATRTLFCGESVAFSVSATGPAEITYQWQHYGTNIPVTENVTATSPDLILNPVLPEHAGPYTVLVSCPCGAVSSDIATLTVNVEPPLINSATSANGTQGLPFTYQITAEHVPTSFAALYLPDGLTNDPATGIITGTPQDHGSFLVVLRSFNVCASATTNLLITIASSEPVITSSLTASGVAGVNFSYLCTATPANWPLYFSAANLPPGLAADGSGLISGQPAYAGEFDSILYAENQWGIGSNVIHISITNGTITGMSITDVATNYSSPYLLDIQFALRDNVNPTNGNPLVVDPKLLTAQAFEDDVLVDTNETALILKAVKPDALKPKISLVLDFTASIADVVANGDTNFDGISDSVDTELASSQLFVRQQSAATLINVYEFHRDDVAPALVVNWTNRTAAGSAIAGIWTNYVNWFFSGSRCWDALYSSLTNFTRVDGIQNYLVFVSDGKDDASTRTIQSVITEATNRNVRIYAIGFGKAGIDIRALTALTSVTGGAVYPGTNVAQMAASFAQIGKALTGQYRLRWATTRRGSTAFLPSFTISYAGLTATSPPNPVVTIIGTNYTWVDTNTTPPLTNGPALADPADLTDYLIIETNDTVYETNYIIAPYKPSSYTGDVLKARLQLKSSPDLEPSGIVAYADYIPRYIRRMRFHFRPNWPCSYQVATNVGDIFAGWSCTATNDGTNGTWLLVSSLDPLSSAGLFTNSIPYASYGNLINFTFRDLITSNSAFAFFEVDTNLYALSNRIAGCVGQTVTNSFNGNVTNFPVMPFGTPVPWLIANGYATPANSNAWAAAELDDFDKDGMPTWREYVANTKPKDATSKLVIRYFARRPDGRFSVTFNTSAYRTYSVQASTDLLNWVTVKDNIPANGADQTAVDANYYPALTTLFYRVQVR